MATGIIQRLDLRHNKASLIDLSTGSRYIFPRSEMNDPDTIKKHDVVTFTIVGTSATDVTFRKRPGNEVVIGLE